MADRMRLNFSDVSCKFSGKFDKSFARKAQLSHSAFSSETQEINSILDSYVSSIWAVVTSAIFAMLGAVSYLALILLPCSYLALGNAQLGMKITAIGLAIIGIVACIFLTSRYVVSKQNGMNAVNEYLMNRNIKYRKHGIEFNMDMGTGSISIELVDIELQDMSRPPPPECAPPKECLKSEMVNAV
eukprot:91482_1